MELATIGMAGLDCEQISVAMQEDWTIAEHPLFWYWQHGPEMLASQLFN